MRSGSSSTVRTRSCARSMPPGAPTPPSEVQRTLWPLFHPDRLGPRFVQRALADTLTAIAEGGSEEFYCGRLAARLVAGAAAAGSPLGAGDLAEHRADWVDALRL